MTERLDGVKLESFQVSPSEKAAARDQKWPRVVAAMERAISQIERFHAAGMPKRVDLEVSPGLHCSRVPLPIERVGLYIPGGTAPLPSTVLMLGVPARLAGCQTRVLCTPPRKDGSMDPNVIVAAELCGIEELFKIGGAQAIAAMAYGTASIPKVDKIFGPGNSWVTEAKAQVACDPEGAAIDMPAGPSEVMVVADSSARADFVAADLLSQAEHGTDSQVILVSPSEPLLLAAIDAVKTQLASLPRREIATRSMGNSRFLLTNDVEEALEVANRYAPEHLILQVESAASWVEHVRNAGSVFLGAWSPEAVGDYASGTNHVLPTYGYARTFSGVSVDSFMKQITFQELSPAALGDIGPTVETLAEIEGLTAHKRAISIRVAALLDECRGKK